MEDKNVVREVMDLSDADPSTNAKVIDKKDLKVEEDEERNAEKAMVPVEKWNSGEKILCFHGPLIYEAKIQTVNTYWRARSQDFPSRAVQIGIL